MMKARTGYPTRAGGGGKAGALETVPPARRATFLWLLLPLLVFMTLMAILLVERSGVPYQLKQSSARFLTPADQAMVSAYSEPVVVALVLYDASFPSEFHVRDTVTSTLDSLRVPYDVKDISGGQTVDLAQYRTVVVTFHMLDHMAQIHELIDWAEQGGRVMFAARPFISEGYRSLYRKLGMISMADVDVEVHGLGFSGDLLPGAQGASLIGSGDFLKYYAYPVQLEATSRLYLTSATTPNVPLLWVAEHGQGRFVVFNTSQLAEKVNRGIYAAAYSLLEDVFAYPVINSSVFLLDNLPAPIPEGDHAYIFQETGRDTRSFFLNIWWPDMEQIAIRYGIQYTGSLVETYNEQLEPPFEPESSIEDHRYLGRRLLNSGGELAAQGYNHVPYCLEKDGLNQANGYPAWPSLESQQQSLRALLDFTGNLYPGQAVSVYLAPSYVLCADARRWIPQVFPQIRVISSVLVGENNTSYEQDFEEAADGIIEFPRVVAGYYLYANSQLALLNELGLHYVNAHLITPDDILDPVRRADRSWEQMHAQFEDQVKWLKGNAPGLRDMTASEAGMAVQRFSRLKVSASLAQDTYTIHLGNFYDQAWLMLRANREPLKITGGKITPVTTSLYLIQADQPDIRITLKEP